MTEPVLAPDKFLEDLSMVEKATRRAARSSEWDFTLLEMTVLSDLVSTILTETAAGTTDDEYYKMAERVAEALVGDGPMLARCLAAMELDRIVHGTFDHGEADPPVDGFVGRAIDPVIDQLLPIVRRREPKWYTNVVEGAYRVGV